MLLCLSTLLSLALVFRPFRSLCGLVLGHLLSKRELAMISIATVVKPGATTHSLFLIHWFSSDFSRSARGLLGSMVESWSAGGLNLGRLLWRCYFGRVLVVCTD